MSQLDRNKGVNHSEEYLSRLCKKAFLSLWSHPRLYKQPGKELCDLLVVFDKDIVIFSDKYCQFPKSGDNLTNWSRWYKRAVLDSARQAWGAERWIKKFPDRIFTDSRCKNKFPLPLPDINEAHFHIVVVSHGTSKISKKIFGGSGSFMVRSRVEMPAADPKPFVIDDINPRKTFVHILDDISLDIVLNTLDTVSDFVSYLKKKEAYLRKRTVFATGEEDLLATYLTGMNSNGEHDFFDPTEAAAIVIGEHTWRELVKNPLWKAKLKADKISYVWDDLVDGFYTRSTTEAKFPDIYDGLEGLELSIRIMAKENRFQRRSLASGFMEALLSSPPGCTFIRVMLSKAFEHPYYAFVFFPWRKDKSDKENREVRLGYLLAVCYVVKLKFPKAQDIVGIASESGADHTPRSADCIYLDARNWTKNEDAEAREAQKRYNILINPQKKEFHEDEYPRPKNFFEKLKWRLFYRRRNGGFYRYKPKIHSENESG